MVKEYNSWRTFCTEDADNGCDSGKISHEKRSICSALLHFINMCWRLRSHDSTKVSTRIYKSIVTCR